MISKAKIHKTHHIFALGILLVYIFKMRLNLPQCWCATFCVLCPKHSHRISSLSSCYARFFFDGLLLFISKCQSYSFCLCSNSHVTWGQKAHWAVSNWVRPWVFHNLLCRMVCVKFAASALRVSSKTSLDSWAQFSQECRKSATVSYWGDALFKPKSLWVLICFSLWMFCSLLRC